MDPEAQEIDLREMFYILIKRWWVLLLTTGIAVAVAAVVSFLVLEPIYTSKTTLFVGREQSKQEGIEYGDIQLNQQLVKDYRELAKRRLVTNEVIERLELSMDSEELAKKIGVNMVQDTRIFEIAVSDNDPVVAMEIANELAHVFIEKAVEIMKVENIVIIDEAIVPKVPVKPNKKLNIAIAGVLGIMLGIGVIFLIEFLDNTIKTPADVEKYLEFNVIGAIPLMESEKGEETV